MRTEIEIIEKFERLNTIAKNIKENHAFVSVAAYAGYTHMMACLLWVMGEIQDLPLERELESVLNNSKEKVAP